jgi:small GTP-binding protein domain
MDNSIKPKVDYAAKVLLIGDSRVGKSCIITRFTENFFTFSTTTTVGNFNEDISNKLGIDYKTKKVRIDNIDIKLQIWDTAGQEKYKSITHNFYKGANGIMIVFDLTDPQSFENVTNWLKQIKAQVGDNVSKLLLANKADLVDERQVSKEQIQDLCKEIDIECIEVSAKTGDNVTEAFMQMSKDIKDKFFPNAKPATRTTVSIRKTQEPEPEVSGPRCCKN